MKTINLAKYLMLLALSILVCTGAAGQLDSLKVTEGEEIWFKVDVPASFPGGMAKFYQYINENLKYPKDARKASVEGSVGFVVDSLGMIVPESIAVIQSLHPSCDEEAIRLILACPKWIPARSTELNRNVRGRVVLPVIFKM